VTGDRNWGPLAWRLFAAFVAAALSSVLVMASGAHRVDTVLLAHLLDVTLIKKASPQFVRNATDQAIGGVAPTGHPERLRTVVDETLARYPVVWTAAGTPDSVMPLSYEQLLAVTEGIALQVR